MLKAVVNSLDDIDEGVRSLYSETGDVFVLQIEGADALPDVKNLKTAYEAEKGKRTKAQQERDAATALTANVPDDFDMEVWNKAKSGEVDQAAIEAATIKMRQTLEGERDEWKGKHETQIKEQRIANANMQLSEALTKAGVSDATFLEAGRAMLAPKVSFDDEGKARVASEMGPMSITDFVERWAKTDGKSFVKPAQGGGDTTTTTQQPIGGANKGTQDLVTKVPGLASLPVR